MGTKYFALIIAPTPVLNDKDEVALWDTLAEARRETSAMHIAAVREIRIFDLNDHMKPKSSYSTSSPPRLSSLSSLSAVASSAAKITRRSG